MNAFTANPMHPRFSLDLGSRRTAYAEGILTPSEVVAEVYRRIRARGDDHVWIALRPESDVLTEAAALAARRAAGEEFPLFGMSFAVRDNLDLAGLPTTACAPPAPS
jgi:allophanate hydrolase